MAASITIPCSCCKRGCSLKPIGGTCALTFIYENVNSIQDDAFDIEIRTANGAWVKVGNIDGSCESRKKDSDCECTKVDTKKFSYTIDQSFVSDDAECGLEFRSVMTKDNKCGTFGTFDIEGPRGKGFGGYMGGSGFIDISKACLPPPPTES